MNSVEDQVRAALRAQAVTLRAVGPLRLTPAPGDGPGETRSGRPAAGPRWHRARPWLAPAGAVAAVLAVAVSLVTARSLAHGPLVPPRVLAPVSSAAPPAPAGSPRYYAAITPLTGKHADGVVLADTVTGKTAAIVAPPSGLTFTSVSAAADDRTFVGYALPVAGSRTQAGAWYEVRFTPGAPALARLSRLRVPPLANVESMAVSESGGKLAVVIDDPEGQPKALQVYSVTTGALLHEWPHGLLGFFNAETWQAGTQLPELTWIDGDQDLAFPSISVFQQNQHVPATWIAQIWRLRLSRGGSNVIASSNLVWSMNHDPVNSTSAQRCLPFSLPQLSADGKTVVCVSTSASLAQTGPDAYRKVAGQAAPATVTWLAFSITAPGTARPLYSTTVPAGKGIALQTAWINASGTAALAEWGLLSSASTVSAVNFGAVSHGALTRFAPPRVSSTSVNFFVPGVTW